jgi:sporulation protein YlmC with PRC-barrel domain|tara:strand:- start:969 stop:1271 length:303 start_codon:yes stop_codon:yes gene_type:complete
MLQMRKVSETFGMKVFTDEGHYFGDIEEAVITQTKIHGWRVAAVRGSYLSKILGNAKGVVVPHQLVKAMGDIVIISRNAVPAHPDEEVEVTAEAPQPEAA